MSKLAKATKKYERSEEKQNTLIAKLAEASKEAEQLNEAKALNEKLQTDLKKLSSTDSMTQAETGKMIGELQDTIGKLQTNFENTLDDKDGVIDDL